MAGHEPRRVRRPMRPLLAGVAVVAALWLARAPLEAALWRSGFVEDSTLRIVLARRILADHDFVGRPRRELEAVFGAPCEFMHWKQRDAAWWIAFLGNTPVGVCADVSPDGLVEVVELCFGNDAPDASGR